MKLPDVNTLSSTNAKAIAAILLIKITIFVYLALAVLRIGAQLFGSNVDSWVPDYEVLGLLAYLAADSTIQYYAKRKTYIPGGPQDGTNGPS